jgi:hypothetical protein
LLTILLSCAQLFSATFGLKKIAVLANFYMNRIYSPHSMPFHHQQEDTTCQ